MTAKEFREKYGAKKLSNIDKSKGGKTKSVNSVSGFYQTKAWKTLSRLVLLHYSIDGISVSCKTCNKLMLVNSRNSQAGHWIKFTDSKAVCLEFMNLAPQCNVCNRFHSGRPEIMEQWLRQTFGDKDIDNLYIKSKNFCKLDPITLDYAVNHYGKLLQLEIDKKGNPWKRTNIRDQFTAS